MLNRSASLAMSISVLKALHGKLDIKRHSPSILYLDIYPCCIRQYGRLKETFCGCAGIPNSLYEPVHEISNNVVCATSKASDQPAHTRSLIRVFASRMNIQ